MNYLLRSKSKAKNLPPGAKRRTACLIAAPLPQHSTLRVECPLREPRGEELGQRLKKPVEWLLNENSKMFLRYCEDVIVRGYPIFDPGFLLWRHKIVSYLARSCSEPPGVTTYLNQKVPRSYLVNVNADPIKSNSGFGQISNKIRE